ncbi:MAG: ArsR/SmtB family transcription factor [Candidatus Hodarchaeota archaeon]
MKEVMVLRDPDKVKIVFNKWRGRILDLLSKKPYTIKELAEILKINPGTVFHHMKILEEAGLIEIIRTEMVGNIVMKFYQSVAREFRFDLLETKDTKIHSIIESKLKKIVDALSTYGITIPDDKKKQVLKQVAEFWDLENKIKENIEVKTTIKDFTADIQREVFILVSLLKLNENKEYMKKRDDLIKLLEDFQEK